MLIDSSTELTVSLSSTNTVAVKEKLLNELMAERSKATALGRTNGLFVQIGAISFFRKLFVLAIARLEQEGRGG